MAKNSLIFVGVCFALTASVCALFGTDDLELAFLDQEQKVLFSAMFSAVQVCICLYLIKVRRVGHLFSALVINNYLDILSAASILLSYSIPLSALFLKWLLIAVTAPPVCWFLTGLLQSVLYETERMRFWKFLWLIPLGFYFIFRLGISPVYAGTTIGTLRFAFWVFVTFLVYYLILRMLSGAHKMTGLYEEMYLSQINAAALSREYSQLQEELDRTAKIQSGTDELLQHLEEMAENQKSGEICRYLSHQLDWMTQKSNLVLCENYALNMILRHYINLAQEENIRIRHRLLISPELPVSEVDVSIIMGNLLENAIQACTAQTRGEKYIELHMEVAEHKFLLSLKNSHSGSIVQKEQVFMSSKREGPGLGVASVKSIVEKYDGIFCTDFDDRSFTADILIETGGEEAVHV